MSSRLILLFCLSIFLLLMLGGCSPQNEIKVRPDYQTFLSQKSGSSDSKQTDWYKELLKTKLVDFHTPKPNVYLLSNGLKVLHLQNKDLPLVEGELTLPFGEVRARSAGKLAEISAIAALLTSAGTQVRNADAQDELMDQLAADFYVNLGQDTLQIGFKCLQDELPATIALFKEILYQPAFASDRLVVWKSNVEQAIDRRSESPQSIARIAYKQLLTDNSELARPLVKADLEHLSNSELQEFYQSIISPEKAFFTVSGNISFKQTGIVTSGLFGKWQQAPVVVAPTVQPAKFSNTNDVYFIDGDFSQSAVYLFAPGPYLFGADLALNEQYYQRILFNQIFGASGFTALLQQKVRKDLGLSYGTFASALEDQYLPKRVIIALTKADSTLETIEASVEVLNDLQRQLRSDLFVNKFKRNLENTFVFKFNDPGTIISRLAVLELLGYPGDYLDTYLQKIRAVTPEQINEVARMWDLNQFSLLVVGKSAVYNQLQTATKDPESFLHERTLRKIKFTELAEF